MDLQACLKLRDNENRKVALRNASGAVIGMLTLNDIRADRPCSALQREIEDNMRPEIIAAVRDGGRLIVTDATAKEIDAFEKLSVDESPQMLRWRYI
jgi:hypothetical protein